MQYKTELRYTRLSSVLYVYIEVHLCYEPLHPFRDPLSSPQKAGDSKTKLEKMALSSVSNPHPWVYPPRYLLFI